MVVRAARTVAAVCTVLGGTRLAHAESPAVEKAHDRSSLEALVRRKRSEAAAATEVESRRLQQIFKEVEREGAMERKMEVSSEEELSGIRLKTRVAEKRESLAMSRAEELSKAEREATREFEAAVAAYRIEAAQRVKAEEAAQLEAAKIRAADELAAAEAGWIEARSSIEEARLAAVRDLESQVEGLVERLESKATEAATRAKVHAQTVALVRVLFQLGSRDKVEGDGIEDNLVLAALEAIPAQARAEGVPSFDHLEDRYELQVHKALAEWLLVPQDLDNGILAHVLGALFSAVGFTTPPLSLHSKQDEESSNDHALARHALVQDGDLRACLDHLAALPPKQDPNPAADWIRDAEARLLADQAAAIIRAKIALAHAEQLPEP